MDDASPPVEGPNPPPPRGSSTWEDPHASLHARLDRDSFDASRLGGWGLGAFSVVDALLKEPGAVYRQVHDGKDVASYARSILLASAAISAAYGGLMGMSGGGTQAAYAAMKLPLVLLGTMAVCLPSFYVFNSILGSKLAFGQTTLLLLCLTGATAILLIGFAPIVWFFGISTDSGGFMAGLHLAAFGIATMYGVRFLGTARHYLARLDAFLPPASGGLLGAWTIVYLLVLSQMGTYLRPWLQPGAFFPGKKELFVTALLGLG